MLVFALAVALLALVSAPPAVAISDPANNCSDDTITYKFVDNSDGTWTTAEKNAVRAGMADWNAVLDWDGGKVVNSLAETTGAADVDLYFHPSPGGNSNSLASAECAWPQATISFNSALEDSWTAADFEHIGRHEMGHLMGLEHTGDDDSFGGLAETMATCAAHASSALSQDDVAAITKHKGDLNPETLFANAGFESGITWFGTSGVASFTPQTGGAQDGADYALFQPSTAGGYVYQSVNLAAPGGSRYIDARVNHRKVSSLTTTGSLTMEILVSEVEYQTGTCGTGWPTGKEQNHRVVGGTPGGSGPVPSWSVVRTETFTTSTSWDMDTESTPYQIPSGWDAADIRVRIRSYVKYTQTGAFAPIAIDTFRPRDQS